MEVCYFGPPGSRLFGAYHAASGGRRRDCGVVLCYPMGREHLSAVRAYRLLAMQLSSAGFPVLRFGLFACGDSEGECREGSVSHWREDVSAAIGELRRRDRPSRFCLAGLRMGASIAMMAGISQLDLQALVLWDPVIQGGPYLRELRLQRRGVLWEVPTAHARSMSETPEDELLGFALSDGLRREIGSIDLLALEPRLPENVLLIQTANGKTDKHLRTRLEQSASLLERHYLPAERIRSRDFRSAGPFMRSRTVSLISAWISRVCQ
jgi:hypothetical protein